MNNITAYRSRKLAIFLGRSYWLILLDRILDDETQMAVATAKVYEVKGRKLSQSVAVGEASYIRVEMDKVIRISTTEITALHRSIKPGDRLCNTQVSEEDSTETTGNEIAEIKPADGYIDLEIK